MTGKDNRTGRPARVPADELALARDAVLAASIVWENAIWRARSPAQMQRAEDDLLEAVRSYRAVEFGQAHNAKKSPAKDVASVAGL